MRFAAVHSVHPYPALAFAALALAALVLGATITRAAADRDHSAPAATAVEMPVAVALDDTARVRRWREDLHAVTDRVLAVHPRPFAFSPRAAFDSAATAIEAGIPRTPDRVLAVEIMRMVALLQDGHTMAIGTLPALGFTSVLPLWLRPCEDGLFVAAAGPEYARLVGARVVRIGARPAPQALERVMSATSGDNRYTRLDRAPLFLMMPQALQALGVVADPDQVALELEWAPGRSERVTVAGGAPPAGFPEAFLESEPQFPAGWASARRIPPGGLPRCDRRPADAWWYEYLPEARVMYLRIRRVEPVSRDSAVADFYRRMFAELDRLRPAGLLIDLRQDHGGNNSILDVLVRGIVQRPWLDRDGSLFTLIDRGVFSAAMNAAVFLEDRTRVTFVGEPTGGRPNHYGDAPERTTPNFGMMFQVSTLPWMSRDPSDAREWIAPAIAIPSTFARWRDGGDPALDAALDAIAHGTLTSRALAAARRGGADAVVAECEAWTRSHPDPWGGSGAPELGALTQRLLDEGERSDAVIVGEAWSRLEPRSGYAWSRLAQAYLRVGDRAHAAQSLRKVLELYPNAGFARRMLESLGEKP